ncbi:MAG: MFS transporter [Verrucomicrobiales bacterium]|nr:MFS transporter [Verrucomicrobiales bacterium]
MNQRLTKAQWMVLVAAFLGWLFDGFEIGLFPVVARPALASLIPGATDAIIGPWMAHVTAAFLLGAASGGVLFGWLGDRIGRVRALSLSILTYSLFTGLGALAQVPWHLSVLRFVAALGMGGEWALGVALVMECWPERFRPLLAGAIGAAANIGFLLTGLLARVWPVTTDSWRWMFLVGAVPALLVFFIRLFVPESPRWRESVRAGQAHPLREVFSPAVRGRTLVAILLASVALIGTWGSVQWLPLWADQLVGGRDPAAKALTMMTLGFGAIVGCLIAPLLGARMGRRPSFFLLCLVSLVATAVIFRGVGEYGTAFLVMAFFVGATSASFYGWFPLYFPELFPTRMRATGQGLAYNFGRIFAAGGALIQGQLVASLGGSYARAGAIVTLVYLVGLAAIWLAPETKDKPLP